MLQTLKTIGKEILRDSKTATFWRNPVKHSIYRWQWNTRPDFQKPGGAPLAVDLEFSNGCNFRCTMCQQATGWLKKKDEDFMSWDTLKLAVAQCVSLGVVSMKVNWRGEPTLDPEVAEKIAYIKSQGIHEVQMNTNASKLTPELCDKLIRSGLDRIIFSCDGIEKKTYEEIRKGGNFDVFMENVRTFRQRRNAIDATRWPWQRKMPTIRINMAVMDQNRGQVGQYREFFKDIADEFFFNSVYQPQASDLNKGQHRTVKRKGCPQIWQRLIVDVHGSVVPCCVDFREKLKMGSVQEDGLKRIWNEKENAIRANHVAHRARQLTGCAGCDNFALSEINEDGEVIWR